ncbi:MAG: efflux RND transporter periplasmic adaptor subunit [Candidatus Zixiibacteriota bacterium]
MRKRHPQILILLLLVFALVIGCGKNQKESAQKSQRSKAGTEKAVPVKVQRTKRENYVERVKASGTIKAIYDVTVSSETSGRVTEILADVGDWVERGQTIVSVDEELKRLALNQAKAQLLSAQSAYRKAKRDLERFEKLYQQKDISEYELENARLQEQTSRANRDLAQASADMAKRQLEDTQIKSPISGQIAFRYVELGELASPGMPVATVVNINQIKIEIGLSEMDVVKVKKGQKVKIVADTYPHQEFWGKVSAVGMKADQRTRTFPVEIRASNPEGKLKPGMVARIEIESKALPDVVLVPQSSVLHDSNQSFVFVVDGDISYKRVVSLGNRENDKFVVLKGLEGREILVVEGQNLLKDGMKVETQR